MSFLLLHTIPLAIFSLFNKTTPSSTLTSPPAPTSSPTLTNTATTTFATIPTSIPSPSPPASSILPFIILPFIAIILSILSLYTFALINKKTHDQQFHSLTCPPLSPTTIPLPSTPPPSTPSTPIFTFDSLSSVMKIQSRRPNTVGPTYNLRARPTKRSGKGWELWCEMQRSTRGARVGEKRKVRCAEGVARKRSRTGFVLEDIVV